MTIKKYHLQEQEIPEGHHILADRLQIQGVHHRKRACAHFCKGRNQSLSFHPDPSNRSDANAIEIHGHWKGLIFRKSTMLGFVDRVAAAKIADLGRNASIHPRLLKTYLGSDGFVEILYQITGPAALLPQWRGDTVRKSAKSDELLNGVDDLISLIEKMLDTTPLSTKEISEKIKSRKIDLQGDPESWPTLEQVQINKPSALNFLQDPQITVRAFNYDLCWQVKVVSDMFDDWLRFAEIPAPHYPNRIGIILRKAKAFPLEKAFYEAYRLHFPDPKVDRLRLADRTKAQRPDSGR